MRKNKSGFTLVEVIVVLVILAILAAIMIPSFTKWIDRAKDKSLIVECRACVLAAQGLLSENYGLGTAGSTVSNAAIIELAQVPGTVESYTNDASATLTHLLYKNGDKTVAYCSKGGCSECGNSETYTVGGQIGGNRQQAANQSLASLADTYESIFQGNGYQPVDGIYKEGKDPTKQFAKAIYSSLSASEQAFLDSVSWSIRHTASGTRIYFTQTVYSATDSATGVRVYKYDPTTGRYQYTDQGKVTNGKVEDSGGKWSDWTDTVDWTTIGG